SEHGPGQGARVLEQPGPHGCHARGTAAVRAGSARRCRQAALEAAAVPGAPRERSAPVDRRLPGLADLMSRISCDECSRADVLRAVAGRGLPAIEAGMPMPAGTGLSRRSFVARSLGLALSLYGAGRLPLLEAAVAPAA